MIESILQLDKNVTLAVYNTLPHSPFFDTFFSFLSFSGSSVIIWLAVFGVIFLKEQRENRKFLFIFLMSMFTTVITSDIVLKYLFQRQRPLPDPSAYWHFACPIDFGFPSTHAAAAFAAAFVLTKFDHPRRWFYYTLAVLISLSRIYLGCHYLADVIAGGIIGTLISFIVLRLYGVRFKSR